MAAALGEALRAKYARRGPAEDQLSILPREEEAAQGPGCCAPEPGAPAALPDEVPGGGRQERRKGRRRRKLRKYGKNVGKVLQKGCRYLVLGLQGLANAYSSPLQVAVSVASAFR